MSVEVKLGGISVGRMRVRIDDCEAIKKDEGLKKFAGRVVIAVPVPGTCGKCLEFSWRASSGLRGEVIERHRISASHVEILATELL
jgi:hypothetical protein